LISENISIEIIQNTTGTLFYFSTYFVLNNILSYDFIHEQFEDIKGKKIQWPKEKGKNIQTMIDKAKIERHEFH
jgi:hypothetical protein